MILFFLEHFLTVLFDIFHDIVIQDDSSCGDNCYNVEGGMTVVTDGDSAETQVCSLLAKFENLSTTYESGSVEGVDGIQFETLKAEGFTCGLDRKETTFPVSKAETQQGNDSGIFSAIFFPLLAVALLIACIFFFIHQRRKKRYRQEMCEIEERVATYIDDLRPHPLNAIDVHTCTSSSCTSCGEGKQQIKFVSTTGPSWLRPNCKECGGKEKDGHAYSEVGQSSPDTSNKRDYQQQLNEI